MRAHNNLCARVRVHTRERVCIRIGEWKCLCVFVVFARAQVCYHWGVFGKGMRQTSTIYCSLFSENMAVVNTRLL